MLKVDFSHADISEEEILAYQEEVNKCDEFLKKRNGLGGDYLGWYDWPLNYNRNEIEKIKTTVKQLKGSYDTVLICGIGGSYLGARAAIEMILGLYPDIGINFYYCGNSLSANYLKQILNIIDKHEVILNVISKSGTTTETAVAFRILKEALYNKYGEEASSRILVTTDAEKGTLKEMAKTKGYKTFIIPGDIGGRYSVITSVGLLPMALAGIDIDEVLKGALNARLDLISPSLEDNQAYRYAVARRIENKKNLVAEMFVTYEPQYMMINEWLKQLFGESEGKEGKGLLPTSATFTTDLHSLGQFIQEGNHCFFETVLHFEKTGDDLIFPFEETNLDKMNYLAGRKLSWINEKAYEGTLLAHAKEGEVDNIVINLKDNSAYTFGYMVYFFFLACGMSCYLLGVNPFNQPGVEVYKKQMFKLLGKE